MSNFTRLIALLLLATPVLAEQNPLAVQEPFTLPSPNLGSPQESVSALVKVTERNLASQKALQEELATFNKDKAAYIASGSDAAKADSMVKSAEKVWQRITQLNLRSVFDADFIKEIDLYHSIANKPAIDQPTKG